MSALHQAEIECQESVAGDGITHQDNEETNGTSGGKERDDDRGWQTVLTVCQKKALAKAGKKLTTTEGDYDFMSPTCKSLSQPTSHRKPHKRTLPPHPKECFKIIVGLFQRLPIRELMAPQIAEAVVNACQGTIGGSQFSRRLKPRSNISSPLQTKMLMISPEKSQASLSTQDCKLSMPTQQRETAREKASYMV
ncbi:hypothetical protein HPB51_015316 [Rhipicephalus microplus]|uniref:Uncharacterized protein n=1 Tax=Rhipicephalus microplus TaxID=6941 RepID=A0A9J6E2F1_RHIMP|nr:hypothetical protein HPB51_015316 [Rhipicephalus microplus]